MSELDDKVREIIMANVSDAGTFDVEGLDPETVDAVIPLIKQVFADEGYVSIKGNYELKVDIDIDNSLPMTEEQQELRNIAEKRFAPMTGQEWYEKFMASSPRQLTTGDELDFNLHDNDPEGNCYYAYNCAIDDMKRAAQKAAGLE